MAISFTVSGNYTLDESSGIQNGVDGTPSGSPRPDSDITLATLQTDASAFYNYLFGNGAGELALDSTFSGNVGAAESSATLINATSSSNIGTLALTTSSGGAFDGTQDSGLMTTSGHEIYLVSALNGQAVLGKYDSDGNGSLDSYAYAVYMKPDGALDTNVNAQLFSVTFTAISNPTAGNTAAAYDEAVDLLQNVYVHASSSLQVNFDNMPSGANLFNDAAESAAGGGIIVFGMNPVINNGTTKYTNASDTIQTSQGGAGATIGVDNQMFNPGNGAYFTFVNDILNDFYAGPGGTLTETEADYAKNMKYASLIESTGASIDISQIQNQSDLAGMTITAYELSQAWQGVDLLSHRGEGSPVTIDAVKVYASDHTTVLESYSSGAEANLSQVINISITNGIASVTGLNSGYIVEWHTTSDHNQVLIQDTAGKFDLGGFGITSGSSQTTSLAGHAYAEDSGPAMTGHALPADDFVQVANAVNSTDTNSFTLAPGTDGLSSATGLGYTIVGSADTSGDYTWAYNDSSHTSITESYKGSALFSLSLNSATGGYTMTMLGTLPYSSLDLDTNNIKAGGPTGSIDVGTLNNGGDYVEIGGTYNNGTAGQVNASNANVGVNNGNLDSGESLSFSLFSSTGTLIPFYGLNMGTKTAQGATYHLYGVLDSDHTTVVDLGIQSLSKGGEITYSGNVLLDSIVVTETSGNAVKIGLAGVHLLLPPADTGFHFTAQLTDGDGDYAQLGFNAYVDGDGGGVDHSGVLFPA
jgi:hypothetical protein